MRLADKAASEIGPRVLQMIGADEQPDQVANEPRARR